MKPEVLCIGQAVVDCITRNIERDPAKPEVSVAESITLGIGGDAVNESCALAKLGVSAGVVIAVGNDPAGSLLISSLAARGVDISRASVMGPPFMTPVANLTINPDGSRSSINARATLLPGYSPVSADISGAKVISLASLFRAPLADPEIIHELVLKAKKNGSVVCADTKLPTFRELSLDELRDTLPLIDYIFPNEKEASYYSGVREESNTPEKESFKKMAHAFLSRGVGHVLIKTGPKGCFAMDQNGSFELPALPVKAVDTTGAGDHFVAGFIAALLKNQSFKACCEAGIRCAGESVTRPGGA